MTRKERIVLLTLSLLIHHGITQSQVHLPHAIRHQCYVHTSSELKNHKEFKKSGKQEQNFSFEDFTLTNESAIKVNFVLVTDDPNLEEFREYDYPIPTLEDYINHLNQSFSELVSIEKWYGFEMARVTKLYSEKYAFVDPTDGDNAKSDALEFFASSETAFSGYVNIFLNDIADEIGIGGTTYINQKLNDGYGPTMMVRRDFETLITVHEMGHIMGMQHKAGFGYPAHFELDLFNGEKLDYALFDHSSAEVHYMGTFLASTFISVPFSNWFFTEAIPSYNTALYDDVTELIFKNWLLGNGSFSEEDLNFKSFQPDNTSVSDPWQNSVDEIINSSLQDVDFIKNKTSGQYGIMAWKGDKRIGLTYKNTSWGESISRKIPASNYVSDVDTDINSSGHAVTVVSSAPGRLHVIEKINAQASWTALENITGPIGDNFSLISSPLVKINDKSNTIVVWEEKEIFFEDAANVYFVEKNEAGWSEKAQLNNFSKIARYPFVVQNNQGDALILWQEVFPKDSASLNPGFEYSKGYSVLKGRYKTFENGWQDEEIIFDNSKFNAGFVSATMDEKGNSLIIWRQAVAVEDFGDPEPENGTLYSLMRFFDGELTPASRVSPEGVDAYHRIPEFNESNILMSEDSSALFAWWGKEDNDYNIYISEYDGKNWNDPLLLSQGQFDAALANLSGNSKGEAVVTWQRYNGENMIIELSMLDTISNAWSNPSRISATNTDSFFPSVSSNENGVFTTTWHSYLASTGYNSSDYVINVKAGTNNPDAISDIILDVESNQKLQLKIYPNPTRDLVYLELPSGHSYEHYRLYDIMGKIMIDNPIADSSINNVLIDMNTFSHGVYVLILNSENKNETFRIIKN